MASTHGQTRPVSSTTRQPATGLRRRRADTTQVTTRPTGNSTTTSTTGGELGAGGQAAPAKTEATKKASSHYLQPAALDTTVREHDHEPYYQDNEGGIRNDCSPGAATRAKAHKPGYHYLDLALRYLQPTAYNTTVREHAHEPYYQDNEDGTRNKGSPGAANRG